MTLPGISLAQRRGNWAQILDEQSSEHYFYNKQTGEVTWDVPADWDSCAVEETLESPMHSPVHSQKESVSTAQVGKLEDLLTGDECDAPMSGKNSTLSIDGGRETSVSEFGMSGKSAAILTQDSKQPVSGTIPDGGSNPFGDEVDNGGTSSNPFGDDDDFEMTTATTEKEDESTAAEGNPFQEDSFEKPPYSPPKPPKPTKSPPVKPPKPVKTKKDTGNPFGDDDVEDNWDSFTVGQSTVETDMSSLTTDGGRASLSQYGRVIRDDEYTVSKKGPKPSDFLAFDDSIPPPPPPTRRSMVGRESQMDAQFRLSRELVQSGYLENMEKMGFRRYNAQVELVQAVKVLEKEEQENAGKESIFGGRKKRLTAKQMAVAALCAQLKEKPLYYDKTIWTQTVFGRVTSWLPDVEDPETGEHHTFYIVSVTVRYNNLAAMTWKINRRMRHFQTLWNKISSTVSSALSPGVLEHPFPSTLGGWFKSNGDKDKNQRMLALTNFFEELLSKSILAGHHDIYEALEEFLEIGSHVAEKMSKAQQPQPRVGQLGMNKRASKPVPAVPVSKNSASQGNPFG